MICHPGMPPATTTVLVTGPGGATAGRPGAGTRANDGGAKAADASRAHAPPARTAVSQRTWPSRTATGTSTRPARGCNYPERTGDLRSILKVADFYSTRQWHSTGLYTDYYRPLGTENATSC
jgi:hypothetical protein